MPDPAMAPQMMGGMPPMDDESAPPAMSPEQAMSIVKQSGIPPDKLAELSMAIDVLEDAGMLPGGEMGEAPPVRGDLDTAIDSAKAKVMGGGQAAPY